MDHVKMLRYKEGGKREARKLSKGGKIGKKKIIKGGRR